MHALWRARRDHRADWLTNLNTSSWTGYVGQAGVLAVAWAIAAITAWRKKNS